jgi:hypothetical protein
LVTSKLVSGEGKSYFENIVTYWFPYYRLMNARGNSLLVEEKERNKVNKALPKLEKELQDLIQGRFFQIGFNDFVHLLDGSCWKRCRPLHTQSGNG